MFRPFRPFGKRQPPLAEATPDSYLRAAQVEVDALCTALRDAPGPGRAPVEVTSPAQEAAQRTGIVMGEAVRAGTGLVVETEFPVGTARAGTARWTVIGWSRGRTLGATSQRRQASPRRLAMLTLAVLLAGGAFASGFRVLQHRTMAAYSTPYRLALEYARLAEAGRRAAGFPVVGTAPGSEARPTAGSDAPERITQSYQRLMGDCSVVACADEMISLTPFRTRFRGALDAAGRPRSGLDRSVGSYHVAPPVARTPKEAVERLVVRSLTKLADPPEQRFAVGDFLAIGEAMRRGLDVHRAADPAGLVVSGLLTPGGSGNDAGFWSLSAPRFGRLKEAYYVVLAQAGLAGANGDWVTAERLVRDAIGTGLAVADGASTGIEGLVGNTLAVRGLYHLVDVLAVSGRVGEARQLASSLAAARSAFVAGPAGRIAAVMEAPTPLARWQGALRLADDPQVPRWAVVEHVASTVYLATCADVPRPEYRGERLARWRERLVTRLAGTAGDEAMLRLALASAPVEGGRAERGQFCKSGGAQLIAEGFSTGGR